MIRGMAGIGKGVSSQFDCTSYDQVVTELLTQIEEERLLILSARLNAEVGYVGALQPIAQSPARYSFGSAWLYICTEVCVCRPDGVLRAPPRGE